MRLRGGLVIAVLLLLGGVGGFAVARAVGPAEHRVAVASPVPATPDLPVDVYGPPAADIDYPTLQPGLSYRPRVLGRGAFAWDYQVPTGWLRTAGAAEGLGLDEYRWRPADEPDVGGFSLRVKLVNTHQTPAEMVAAKEAALLANPDAYVDFTVVSRTSDTLAFTYRLPSSDRLRSNTFRWIAPPGGTEATIEMSVVGRQRDEAGLTDLLTRVSGSFRPRPR